MVLYYYHKLNYFQKAKFNYGYENLKSAPVIFENFGYVDPQSVLIINKLIKSAPKNMNKTLADVNYVFKQRLALSYRKLKLKHV